MTSLGHHLCGGEHIDVRGDHYNYDRSRFWTTIDIGQDVDITLHSATIEQLQRLRDKLELHIKAMSRPDEEPEAEELVGELNPVDEAGKPV